MVVFSVMQPIHFPREGTKVSDAGFPERFLIKIDGTVDSTGISYSVICDDDSHSLGGNTFSFVTYGYTPPKGEIVQVSKKRHWLFKFRYKWVLAERGSNEEHELDNFDL